MLLFGNLYFMRHLNDFYVPEVRTEFLRRFPFNSFPTAGNFLSSEFKEISQRSMFKQSLKAKLLDNLKDFHIWSKSWMAPNQATQIAYIQQKIAYLAIKFKTTTK